MWICVRWPYHVHESLCREIVSSYPESFDVGGFDQCEYDMWLINSRNYKCCVKQDNILCCFYDSMSYRLHVCIDGFYVHEAKFHQDY